METFQSGYATAVSSGSANDFMDLSSLVDLIKDLEVDLKLVKSTHAKELIVARIEQLQLLLKYEKYKSKINIMHSQ